MMMILMIGMIMKMIMVTKTLVMINLACSKVHADDHSKGQVQVFKLNSKDNDDD